MIRFLALVTLLPATACVTFFPPHGVDLGRGAEPLTPGTLQAHGGVGGGAAAAGLPVAVEAGGGLEGQVSKDLAVGFDLGTGYQGTAGDGTILPGAGYITAQYNPTGMDHLAVRASAGIGEDIVTVSGTNAGLSPWAAVTGGIVTSTKLGSLEPYLCLDVGLRKFIGGPDNKLIQKTAATSITHSMFAGGATLGANYALGDALGIYAAANVAGLMLLADEAQNAANAQPQFVPSVSGQVGITYSFAAPN